VEGGGDVKIFHTRAPETSMGNVLVLPRSPTAATRALRRTCHIMSMPCLPIGQMR
jgi:hypothetical protein